MIATVANKWKVRFMIYPGGLKPRRLIVFMQRLIMDAPRKAFLIPHNLNAHKAKVGRGPLEEHVIGIVVLYLPQYSPEVNPSERFNGDLKREIHRGVPLNAALDLKQTMPITSRCVQKSPSGAHPHFKHRNIEYAAQAHAPRHYAGSFI